MVGRCDATFLGAKNPLQEVVEGGRSLHSTVLYGGGEQEIHVADYESEGGSIRFSTRLEDLGGIRFTGEEGLRDISTSIGRGGTLLTTIAQIKQGGEVIMCLEAQKHPMRPAFIKFTHTVDNI